MPIKRHSHVEMAIFHDADKRAVVEVFVPPPFILRLSMRMFLFVG